MKLPDPQPLALRIARALLILSLRPELRKRLRAIFRIADAEVPQALAQGATPVAVESVLAGAIKVATAVAPTSDEVRTVAALYDVISAAVPLARR